jgi:hypothetical protein
LSESVFGVIKVCGALKLKGTNVPSVIDSLIVELSLDANQFKEGSREVEAFLDKAKSVTTRLGESVEGTTHKITEVFTALKGGFGGLLGVLGGAAIGSFIDRVIQMDAHTSRLARSLGTNTRELSIWQGIVKQVGGTAEEASASFAAMSDAMAGIQAGAGIPSGPQAMVMARAGIRAGMPVSEILDRLAQFSEKSQAGGMSPQMVRFFLQQFPGMSQGMINALMGGTKELERMRKAAADLAPLEEERAKQAEAMQKDFAQLDLALIRLARETFPGLAAVINDLTSDIKSLVSGDWKKFFFGSPEGGDLMGQAATATREGIKGMFGFLQGTSRGDRNNNPGNIKMGAFAKAHGATGEDEMGFAKFPDSETGMAAMAQLLAHSYQGLTVEQIVNKWAPDHTPGYLAAVLKETGLKASDKPDLYELENVTKMMRGISRGEGTHLPTGTRQPGGVRAPAPTPGVGATSSSTSTSSVTIGTINIASSKADPKEVAAEIPDQAKRWITVASADYALTG